MERTVGQQVGRTAVWIRQSDECWPMVRTSLSNMHIISRILSQSATFSVTCQLLTCYVLIISCIKLDNLTKIFYNIISLQFNEWVNAVFILYIRNRIYVQTFLATKQFPFMNYLGCIYLGECGPTKMFLSKGRSGTSWNL